jgi:hypothetical protein
MRLFAPDGSEIMVDSTQVEALKEAGYSLTKPVVKVKEAEPEPEEDVVEKPKPKPIKRVAKRS